MKIILTLSLAASILSSAFGVNIPRADTTSINEATIVIGDLVFKGELGVIPLIVFNLECSFTVVPY
jgi:hypothetical protein